MMGCKIGSIIGILMLTIIVGIKGSSAQESVNRTCLVTIGTCLQTSSNILDCCPGIKDAILEERDCFCLSKEIFRDNATLATAWATTLTFCSITASLDTLCPDSNSSPGVPPSSSPESPVLPPSSEISPTESPVSLPTGAPTPSSPDDTLFPPTLGSPPSPTDELFFPPAPEKSANNNDTKKGSGGKIDSNAMKIGYPMGLLSSSALLIWAILLS